MRLNYGAACRFVADFPQIISNFNFQQMKRYTSKILKTASLSLLFVGLISCKGQNKTPISIGKVQKDSVYGPMPKPVAQISRYIRRMFQDKDGNIWFGTNDQGVCRFDGKNYTYYALNQGFSGHAVRGILQDQKNQIWFATDGGLSRYDGKEFTIFNTNHGLLSNAIWSILEDKSGQIWIGSEAGVLRYDGKKFVPFALPATDLTNFPMAYPSPRLVNCMLQDKAGNIWFGSNGNGVYKYDGVTLVNFSEKDGLCNNFVQCLLEDKDGMLWMGSRFGGLSRFDGKTFATFTDKNGLGNNFVWTIYQDQEGNIWTGNAGGGLNRLEGKSFRHFSAQDGLPNQHVQSLLEDKDGKFWIGTSGGAFQFDGKNFTNITREIEPNVDGC